jgi:ABC-type polysaccharide/polyol phosphate export permease
VSVVSELSASRELLVNLTQRELKGKYKGSVLGWGWSLLNPLATMAIYTVVFSFFLRVKVPVGERTGIKVFALWLVCGLLVWNLMSNAITAGIASLTSNSNLIKKVWFPRETLVLSTVFALVVTLGIELLVLSVALAFYGNVVLLWLPGVLGMVFLLMLFVTGLALGLSVANVYFRDLQYLVSIGLQMWFYLTPIIYPPSLVYDQRGHELAGVSIWTLYQLNPAFSFVESFRDLLYDQHYPSLGRIGYCAAWSLVTLALGFFVFRRYEGRLAEEL